MLRRIFSITRDAARRYPINTSIGRHNVRNMASAAKKSGGASDMKDEYGTMDSSGETYVAHNFVLESGKVLKEAHVSMNI
jgi:hypothetical protein